MARPIKLDAARIERLLTALAAGHTRRSAALFAGVTARTVERKQARDRDLRRSGSATPRNGRCSGRSRCILNAAPTQWQAAAWWLERRYPNDWGRHLALGGPGGGVIAIAGPAAVIVLPDNQREPPRGPPRRGLPPPSIENGNGNGNDAA